MAWRKASLIEYCSPAWDWLTTRIMAAVANQIDFIINVPHNAAKYNFKLNIHSES